MKLKSIINELLFENESSTLDFKSEQYKFIKAEDREKKELLKDILAFANAWRSSDAYILIGAQEVKGEKAQLVGINEDLDDAQLQQFVNSKVNNPIDFSYHTLTIEGVKIAVIHIPVSTERPYYLKKRFANLNPHEVFIRRGSSTETASPTEIAEMGKFKATEPKALPSLECYIDQENNMDISTDISHEFKVFEVPSSEEIFQFLENRRHSGIIKFFTPSFDVYEQQRKSSYYHDYAKYLQFMSSFFHLKIGVKNEGNVVANNILVQIDINNCLDRVSCFNEYQIPIKPQWHLNYGLMPGLSQSIFNNSTDGFFAIEDLHSGGCRISYNLGKIYAKGNVVHDKALCFRVHKSCKLELKVKIFADELESPVEQIFMIETKLVDEDKSVKDLIELMENYALV